MRLLVFVIGYEAEKYVQDIATAQPGAVAVNGYSDFWIKDEVDALYNPTNKYVLVSNLPRSASHYEYVVKNHVIPNDLSYHVRVIHLFHPTESTAWPYYTVSMLLTKFPQCLLTVDVSAESFRPLIQWHALVSAVEAQVFATRRG